MCYNIKCRKAVSLVDRIVGIVDVGGTPVPIPNTEVKPNGAENTWEAAPRKNRKMPTLCRVVVQ